MVKRVEKEGKCKGQHKKRTWQCEGKRQWAEGQKQRAEGVPGKE